MGRPCKLTPIVQERIIGALWAGNTRHAAAGFAGIAASTLSRWIAQAERARNGKFKTFWNLLRVAENVAEMRCVMVIQESMRKDWRAAAWWLERRRQDEWGKRENVDITIHREAERVARETGLDAEDIVAEAERLLRHG